MVSDKWFKFVLQLKAHQAKKSDHCNWDRTPETEPYVK